MSNADADAMAALGLIALVVILVVATPLTLIWALNTLFPALAIPYSFWTWLAALILGVATMGSTAISSGDR